jgi:hypothetical protein
MNQTTLNLNKKAFTYILNAIDGDNYGIVLNTDAEKLQFLSDTFEKEYGFMIKKVGYLKALIEWMQGLPSAFNVDFENYRIIEIAKEWGSIPEDATDKQEDKILDNWFNLIANKTI